MYLGDLRIAGEEIERISWENGELTLDVRWIRDDLPLLFDLPGETLLRWHEDDPAAGIPVELCRWRFEADQGLHLVVALRPPVDAE